MFSERNTMDTYTDFSRPATSNTSITITTSLESTYFLNATNHTINNDAINNNNMTTEEILEYLERLQNEEIIVFIPTLSFIILIAVLGLFGNSLVLLVYKFRFSYSPKRIFIMGIAAFDLIGNVICMPADVYSIFHLWSYPNASLCRISRFLLCSTYMTSGFFLLGLAIDRYLKVCRPFGRQITVCHAKIMIITFAFFGCISSILYAIINGIQTKPTPHPGIFGHTCNIDDAYVDTIWPFVNNALFILDYLCVFIPVVVIYVLIGIQAFKHRKMISKLNKKDKRGDESTQRDSNREEKQEASDIDEYPIEADTDYGMVTSSASLTHSSVDDKFNTGIDPKTEYNFKSDPISDFNRITSPRKTAKVEEREIESKEPGGKFFSSSHLQWRIDIARCYSHNFHAETGKNSPQVTPTKISSLSSKTSMEKILLHQQIGIQGGFVEQSRKGRKTVEDTEKDMKAKMRVETNTATKSEKDVTAASKTRQTNTRRKKNGSSKRKIVKRNNSTKYNNQRGNINRTTVMVIMITFIFVLSYVPYLTAAFIRSNQPDKVMAMGNVSLAVYHLCFRTSALNCAANAIIYSLCDYKFRKESLNLLRCKQ